MKSRRCLCFVIESGHEVRSTCAGDEAPMDAPKAPMLLEVIEDRGYTRHRQRDCKNTQEHSRFKDKAAEGAA